MKSTLRRNMSSSLIRTDNIDIPPFSLTKIPFQQMKHRNKQTITDIIQRYYFSNMLKIYEQNKKLIPNPIQLIQKIRLLEKKNPEATTTKITKTGKQKIYLQNNQKKTKASSILTIKTGSQTKIIKQILEGYLEDIGLKNKFQISGLNAVQLISQFVKKIKKYDRQNITYKDNAIKKINAQKQQLLKNFRETQKIISSFSLKKSMHELQSTNTQIAGYDLKNMQSSYHPQQLRKTQVSPKKPAIKFSSHTNLTQQQAINKFDSQSFIDLKVDSDNNSENMNGIHQHHRQYIQKLDIEYKTMLETAHKQAQSQKQKIIQFWKNYMFKIVDQYETDIQKYKEQIQQLKSTLELYQHQLNHVNSYSNWKKQEIDK